MGRERFDALVEELIPGYADDHVKAGTWAREEAVVRAREEFGQLLPNGLDTPDHYFRTIAADDGTDVGDLWYHRRAQGNRAELFVYWIGIDERHRRHGYAAAALSLLETEARRLGADRIALHVFGANAGARALYERLGYAPTNILMAKELAPTAPGTH